MRERVAKISTKKLKKSDLIIYQELLGRIGVMGRNRKKHYVPDPKLVTHTRMELEKLIVRRLGVHAVRAYSAAMSSLSVAAFPESGAYSRLTEEGFP